jgi:hypothetical protein
MEKPSPVLLDAISAPYCNRWVPVTEALPPIRFSLIVMVRGDDSPAFGWMKFAAGDRDCPYFVVPQRAAIKPRGCGSSKPKHAKDRMDVTHWWTSGVEIPFSPEGFENVPWGLGGSGWESCEAETPAPVAQPV